jgi:hypothetical protein
MAMSVFPVDSYEEFLHGVLQDYHYQPVKDEFRLGQIFFNKLCVVRPDIAEVLRGSMLDPFFKQRIANVVSDFVRDRW